MYLNNYIYRHYQQMQQKPTSTVFKFILTPQQLFSNLDHLKLQNYERFLKVGEVGKQIQLLAKQDNQEQLQKLCDKNFFDIQFMKMEIQDAFSSALKLRNDRVIKYFLSNGLSLSELEPACIPQLCFSLEYLSFDPPIDLLRLLLQYGGNPRQPVQNSDTALHLAARYGNLDFVKALVEYGADVNAVNDQRMTPLGETIKKGGKDGKGKWGEIAGFLRSKGGKEKWNQ